jgi:hypothetical protein
MSFLTLNEAYCQEIGSPAHRLARGGTRKVGKKQSRRNLGAKSDMA